MENPCRWHFSHYTVHQYRISLHISVAREDSYDSLMLGLYVILLSSLYLMNEVRARNEACKKAPEREYDPVRLEREWCRVLEERVWLRNQPCAAYSS